MKRDNRQKARVASTKAKVSGFALCALLLAPCSSAEAQQKAEVPRIAHLTVSPASSQASRLEGFKQGLRKLGYIEGKNILIEYRYAEGKRDRLPSLVAEVLRLKVDVIVSAGSMVTRLLKQATSTIPIVMAQDTDPVGNGFVASLARPKGNVTGLATLRPELSGKQLELLKEIIPRLSLVAVIGNSTNPGNAQVLKEIERAAAALEVKLQYVDVRTLEEIVTQIRDASMRLADAVLVLPNSVLYAHRKQVVDLAVKSRLPSIHYLPEWLEDGGLMSYGVSYTDLYRRAAGYVDKILKGAKPADLPVELPTKFDLVINLKTARALGLKIPAQLLMEADRVIQ